MDALILDNALGTLRLGDDGVAVLRIDVRGRPANLIDEGFILGLEEAVAALEERAEDLRGVVVASARESWLAGADIGLFLRERSVERLFEAAWRLSRVYRRLETLGVPVAAAITGAALGGGYELALACHHRVALPGARVGLPEVRLGVLPGAGGTQRLPRLIGLQPAIEVVLQGRTMSAAAAAERGMVDALADTPEAVEAAARAWVLDHPGHRAPWDRADWRWPDPAPDSEAGRQVLLAAAAMLYRRTAGSWPAAEEALAVLQEGARLRLDRALELESRAFARIAALPRTADTLRTLWVHREAARRGEGLPPAPEDPGFRKVAVLGAGMMGAGLAFVLARAGFEVVLKDIDAAVLERARRRVEEQVARRLRRAPEAERAAVLGRVTTTLDAGPSEGADLVIEAVVEDVAVKHRVLRELEGRLAPGAVWASNTSALPIAELSAPSAHPERFVGLHFFSPVEVMPLVEIVRGPATSDETVGRCLALVRRLDRVPIVVRDGYGFFTSRVFAAYIMEGVALVVEGHAPALVEWSARAAGMAVPPLQVFDEVSLALGRHVLEEAERRTGRPLPGAAALLRRMVDEHGRLGRAHGAGFYDYAGRGGRREGLWEGLAALAADIRGGAPARAAGVEALGRRLLLAQCAEAARALDDGVLERHRDADLGAVLGIGFAPGTGGPLAWMDRQGLGRVVAELDALADAHGDRFRPAPVLRRMAEAGERFYPEG